MVLPLTELIAAIVVRQRQQANACADQSERAPDEYGGSPGKARRAPLPSRGRSPAGRAPAPVVAVGVPLAFDAVTHGASGARRVGAPATPVSVLQVGQGTPAVRSRPGLWRPGIGMAEGDLVEQRTWRVQAELALPATPAALSGNVSSSAHFLDSPAAPGQRNGDRCQS